MAEKKENADEVAFRKLTAKDARLEKLCRMAGRNRILEVFKMGVKRGKSTRG